MRMRKMALLFAALFVLLFLTGIIMAYFAGVPIKLEEQLAESFYYAAIGFAVYHIFTRNKKIREEKAREQEEADADAGEENEDDIETVEFDGEDDAEPEPEAEPAGTPEKNP